MINSPAINIVDSHHKALSAWAAYRTALDHPPRLITLDHHTDTSQAFRRWISKVHGKNLPEDQFLEVQNSYLNTIDFTKPQTVNDAISKLSNDEHIITGIKSKIISSAFVVAHNAVNTDLQTYKKHRIICHSVNEIRSRYGKFALDYDGVLNSSFLNQALAAFDKILTQANEDSLLSKPYIFDIDLDYFNTFKSIHPENASTFKMLARNAGLITLATEPEYVKSCAIDEGLTSECILKKVLTLIE